MINLSVLKLFYAYKRKYQATLTGFTCDIDRFIIQSSVVKDMEYKVCSGSVRRKNRMKHDVSFGVVLKGQLSKQSSLGDVSKMPYL